MKHLIFSTLFLFCCLQATAQDYLQTANASFDKGDYSEAIKNYNLFKAFDGSKDVSALLQKAQECLELYTSANNAFEKEEYEQARDGYKALIEKNPNDLHAKQQYDLCQELLTPAPISTTLFLSPTILSFSSSGGIDSIKVTTNADDYEIVALPDWCSVTDKNADGFTLSCRPWNENVPREDYFYVRAHELLDTIMVTQSAAPAPKTQPIRSTASSSNEGYKKSVFGIDVGVGTRNIKNSEWGSYQLGTFIDAGIRFTRNFSPYIGWDLFTLKCQVHSKEYIAQAMTGLRAFTPAFIKEVKGYAGFKAGYGMLFKLEDSGLVYEFEAGIYLTKMFSIGFAYNAQHLKGTFSDQYSHFNSGYTGLRIGIDF